MGGGGGGGYILSLINHTNKKQNASILEDFKQQVNLSLCNCGNAQTSNPLYTKQTEMVQARCNPSQFDK